MLRYWHMLITKSTAFSGSGPEISSVQGGAGRINSAMRRSMFPGLEKKIGCRFRNKALLEAALTHPSFRSENQDSVPADNQRLEFLGDAVLGLLSAEALTREHPAADEGSLTKMKSALISGSALAVAARTLGLGEHLRLGKGEAAYGGADRDSNLEDALEALLGAVWLDGGLKAARRFFENHVYRSLAVADAVLANPKGALQEYAQKQGFPIPEYRVTEESGPDHARRYCVEVTVSTYAYRGEGTSRREAEKKAAEKAVQYLIKK